MTKHMEIRDAVFEKLGAFKGKGSWSDAIESLIERSASVEPAKTQTDAASHRPIKESVPA